MAHKLVPSRRSVFVVTVERFYVAVTPPAEVIDALSDLPTKPRRGVRYTKRNQWHVTLRYLGDCERHEALSAFEDLDARSAQVTLGDEVCLLGERVVMVPASGLDQLAEAVDTAFAGIGEPRDHAFNGHLTLARLKGAPLREPSSVSVLGTAFSATFAADDVALIKTETSPEGATHTVVATQQLT